MDIPNENIMRQTEFGAKYVFCLMRDVMARENPMLSFPQWIIPKYTIGWTDMEIKGAPDSAVIPFFVLDGKTVIQLHAKLYDLHIIEKL